MITIADDNGESFDPSAGVQVRISLQEHKDVIDILRLVAHVYPVPEGVALPLATFLRAQILQFLTTAKITDGTTNVLKAVPDAH